VPSSFPLAAAAAADICDDDDDDGDGDDDVQRRHGKGAWSMVRDACKRVTGGNQRLVERDDSAGDGDKSCVSAMVAVKWSRELDEIDAAAAGPD
jgi:hypothetical protein